MHIVPLIARSATCAISMITITQLCMSFEIPSREGTARPSFSHVSFCAYSPCAKMSNKSLISVPFSPVALRCWSAAYLTISRDRQTNCNQVPSNIPIQAIIVYIPPSPTPTPPPPLSDISLLVCAAIPLLAQPIEIRPRDRPSLRMS